VWSEGREERSIKEGFEFEIEKSDQNNDQNDPGEGVKNIDETHHRVVGSTPQIASDQSVGHADEKRNRGANQSNEKRDSSSI
jgi:hypothetical protein